MPYNISRMANKPKRTWQTNYPYLLVIGGFIGLAASFTLTLEKIALLKDAGHQLSCSLNPVLSCLNVINSHEASAFGFPNPLIGLMGFSVVITVGMGMLAGARYKKWFFKGLLMASTLALVFIHWLIFITLYHIGALCLYCMIVWSVTVPIFWYTLLYCLDQGFIQLPGSLKKVTSFARRHHLDIVLAWYVLVIAVIIQRFWYYWSTLL